jgi:hypothetical protein
MTKLITRVCIDCKIRVKNRSKTTLRCATCYQLQRKSLAKGRDCGNCKICNKKLTIKKNKTGTCINCMDRSKIVRTKTYRPAWNKGMSIFTSQEHKKQLQSETRKRRRLDMPMQEKIADRIRTLIRLQMKKKSATKRSKTVEIIGCSIPEYVKHIENQFESWMNWDNYGNKEGQWNIDHIKPVSKFNLLDESQVKLAFHFTNCRPLLASENFRKSDKLTATVTFGYKH